MLLYGSTHIASNTSTARVNPVVDCPSPVVTDSVNTTDALPISGNVSPAHVNMQPSLVSDPFHLPFKMGWFREVVTRKDSNKQKQQPVDVYYYSPKPHFKQFRSDQDIKRNLSTDGLSSKNFCWKPIAIYHEPQELIRQAGDPTVKKLYSRVWFIFPRLLGFLLLPTSIRYPQLAWSDLHLLELDSPAQSIYHSVVAFKLGFWFN